ncbi:hypothetical protein [Wenxinia saemankumensis]|uniref:Uncharacterized protein n=1 Tax=Wenxinia saemankumensis TaxID=1447782 RepID=A0A1M6F0Z0_9RHOB|nr:hypothetical protein [Wenxinia saemankumensis]SHI91362.1 hypothetical protein SAMN05444417_2292 [Wenxinia saemankumensis]
MREGFSGLSTFRRGFARRSLASLYSRFAADLTAPHAYHDFTLLPGLFTDAAATTPLVPGDPMGFAISPDGGAGYSGGQFKGLGTERAPAPTAWTPSSANWVVDTSAGRATLTNAANSGDILNLGQLVGDRVGQVFLVSFNLESVSGTGIRVGSSRATDYAAITSPGRHHRIIHITLAGSGTMSVSPALGGVSAVISEISIRPLPGNHATQPSSAARPVIEEYAPRRTRFVGGSGKWMRSSIKTTAAMTLMAQVRVADEVTGAQYPLGAWDGGDGRAYMSVYQSKASGGVVQRHQGLPPWRH